MKPIEDYADKLFSLYHADGLEITAPDLLTTLNKEQLTNYSEYDLVSLMNKSIRFLQKMQEAYNTNPAIIGNMAPHYKELLKYSPIVLTSYRTHGEQKQGFKFSPTQFIPCNDINNCFGPDILSEILLLPYTIKGDTDKLGIYVLLFDHPIGIIINTPEFIDNLTGENTDLLTSLLKYYKSFITKDILLSPDEVSPQNWMRSIKLKNNLSPPSYLPPEVEANHNYRPTNTIMNKDILVSVINKNIDFFKTIKRRVNRNDYTIPDMTMDILPYIYTDLVCHLKRKCIGIHNLPNISFMPYHKDSDQAIFIVYNGRTNLGALLYDPSFINALSDKERAFVDLLFEEITKITPTATLNKYMFFNGLNLSEKMTPPDLKFNERKLTFSENVNVRYIPRVAKTRRGGKRSSLRRSSLRRSSLKRSSLKRTTKRVSRAPRRRAKSRRIRRK
jgi:hypothetical protein